MRGKDAIVEEVLDWRPFDYFTVSTLLPIPGAPRRCNIMSEIEGLTDETRYRNSGVIGPKRPIRTADAARSATVATYSRSPYMKKHVRTQSDFKMGARGS
jgi:hypothetical protein